MRVLSGRGFGNRESFSSGKNTNMTLHFYHFLIVCPLAMLGGFVDAVAGGGGLISLPAYMIAGLPVHFAIGTNKLSSAMGTTVTTARFSKMGFIPWKQAPFYAACALAGSATGARLALLLDDRVFKILMLFILPLTAFFILRKKDLLTKEEELPARKTLLIGMAVALVVGTYDGFYGPGTGTFLMLLLTSLAHLPLTKANGVTKVINLTTNVTALAVFLLNGKVLILLGLVAGVFGIAGNYIGSSMFKEKGAKIVRPLMLAVLAVFFVRILTEVL